MGVDYIPVGGIGIKVTHEIKKKLTIVNEGDCCGGCMDSLLSDLELEYAEAGDGSYTGEENTYYLMVQGSTLVEINENTDEFISKLKSYDIDVSVSDVKVISELHIC
jgi:hypothetical protein